MIKFKIPVLVAGVMLVVGCTRWNFLRPERQEPPPKDAPSVAALVKYLNTNSDLIQSLSCLDMDLTATSGLQSFGMQGKMMVEKPRKFRMGASVGPSKQVDLGSNDEEFWYWISKANPPYQVYCRYKDLNEGRVRQLPFPFQPEWVIEAMGLGVYGPAENYQLEADSRNLKLVQRTVTPQGRKVRKVIVMNRLPVKAPQPQVVDYLLLDDASGKEIAAAHITKVRLVPVGEKTAAIVPHRIEFRWPEASFKLSMIMDGVNVNKNLPPDVFIRRPGEGIPSLNLATGRVDQPLAGPIGGVRRGP